MPRLRLPVAQPTLRSLASAHPAPRLAISSVFVIPSLAVGARRWNSTQPPSNRNGDDDSKQPISNEQKYERTFWGQMHGSIQQRIKREDAELERWAAHRDRMKPLVNWGMTFGEASFSSRDSVETIGTRD